MAEMDKKKIALARALNKGDMEEHNEIQRLNETEIPIERTISEELEKVDDTKMFSDLSEVDIGDLWVEDEKEMRRKIL